MPDKVFNLILKTATFNGEVCYNNAEEKVLKWTDLKVGDVITNGGRTAIVTEIDKENSDNAHIYAGHMWFTNYELKHWEKVEEK